MKTRSNGEITSCKLFYNGTEVRDDVTINSDFFNNEDINPVIIVKFDIASSPLYKKLKEFDRIGGSHSSTTPLYKKLKEFDGIGGSHSSTTPEERSGCNCNCCCNGDKKKS